MGVYPKRLKYVIIKPLHKKCEKIDMSNYRPMSIVTGFAKIFEMVIFKTLNDHVVTHKILSPQQYGFQKGLSTEDAIFKLTHVIQCGIETSMQLGYFVMYQRRSTVSIMNFC
jgi:hypothetical protein